MVRLVWKFNYKTGEYLFVKLAQFGGYTVGWQAPRQTLAILFVVYCTFLMFLHML